MKRIVRRFGQQGSVRKTAASLDMGTRRVRKNLKLSRNLSKVGPYRTVNCPKDPGIDLF